MTTPAHEYTDWQMHYEDCPRCAAAVPCDAGRKIRDAEQRKKESKP